jgi:hypothetical protein
MIGSWGMRGKAAIFACVRLGLLRAGIVASSLAFVLLVSGCSSLEEKLIQEGIGTELPAVDIAESTRRLDAYLNYLCAQAGGTRTAVETPDAVFGCDMNRYGGAGWSLLVRAGFNDIDRRCDSYLGWLSARRRDRSAILSQIHDTRTFTEALLYTTGVGAAPIAIAGLAFGLASNSFTNYYSRLLFEIEKSTVSVLVHEKRLQYREKLGSNIAFQPDAVHVLREYLLICTPFYIEDLINQRTRDSVAGNDPADKGNADQIRRSIVAGALLGSIPKTPRDPLSGVGNNPRTEPLEPRMAGGITESEQAMSKTTGQKIQASLCIQPTASFDKETRTAIVQAKLGANQSNAASIPFNNIENQIVSAGETQKFLDSKSCFSDAVKSRKYRTIFEKFAFSDQAGIQSLQTVLAACDPTLVRGVDGQFSGKFDDATRKAITVAKKEKMNAKRKAELTDADTDTLNDKSYNNITLTCR